MWFEWTKQRAKMAKATFHLSPGLVNYFFGVVRSVHGAVMVPISGGLAPEAVQGCNLSGAEDGERGALSTQADRLLSAQK